MYVILNPVAGSGKVQKLQERIVASIKSIDPEAEFVKTISPGDATHLSKVGIKKGHQFFVCAGGDGTINEIVNGIIGHDIKLGIVPCGQNNYIANTLNIPSKVEQAVKLFSRPHDIAVDVGMIGQKCFLMSTGFGMEVEIASEAYNSHKTMAQSMWKQVKPYLEQTRLMRVKLYVDDQFLVTMDTISCSIVNMTTYHQKNIIDGNFNFTDNKLHVVAFSPKNKEHLAAKLLSGKQYAVSDMRITQFTAKKIHILYPEDVPLHADGEILRQTTPIEISLHAQKQHIVVEQ
jgi:YegS/Rv2252/BmrU family lipid kinase